MGIRIYSNIASLASALECALVFDLDKATKREVNSITRLLDNSPNRFVIAVKTKANYIKNAADTDKRRLLDRLFMAC